MTGALRPGGQRPKSSSPLRQAADALAVASAPVVAGQLPDAEISARSTRHAAWIAAVAAVIAALIAILGVFRTGYKSDETSTKAAEIGAKAGIQAAQTQVSGETERSRAELLRGQRQNLYAKVIGHTQALIRRRELKASRWLICDCARIHISGGAED